MNLVYNAAGLQTGNRSLLYKSNAAIAGAYCSVRQTKCSSINTSAESLASLYVSNRHTIRKAAAAAAAAAAVRAAANKYGQLVYRE
jgi:hypothetical protein